VQKGEWNMTVGEILQQTKFGSTIAEDERSELSSYFVETDQWRRIFAGEVDVVYGPKGSGKSAIYALLLAKINELFDRGIIAVAAENPQGAPAFKDLVDDPPTSESEFRNLWKLYFLILVAQTLREFEISPKVSAPVIELLEKTSLLSRLPNRSSLSGIVRTALDYVRRFVKGGKSLETELKLDPVTGNPVGIAATIAFTEPSNEEKLAGIVSADDLLRQADEALAQAGLSMWLLLDRLDVAFAEVSGLERNALRALFRVYSDLRAFENISLKIFLRTDIWQRILDEGFREASHIRRQETIKWDDRSLMNLVVRRALHNRAIREYYGMTAEEVLADADRQQKLFYQMFPDQVDPGSRRPETFRWMLDRTCDGTGQTAPRELIHLVSAARNEQLKFSEIGTEQPNEGQLFSRLSLKAALPEVSRVRFEQTLCAEFPDLRPWMQKLEGEKTEQTPSTLAKIWRVSPEEALATANRLEEVGFFEPRGSKEDPRFWVPFLYRDALEMVQGAAD
jgi:hypothetical protein